ncbi:hypothetical protein AALO_G00228770 [Alosa alosa]|uniref:GB1/RHD3-type G domain-containing protein n=1 Tax=Alosa alosa TaxID=278164 RepID=A0AAV6FUU9_9TELE|nr:hypothetical protein AALO_G00228770 [Alosa alosa]
MQEPVCLISNEEDGGLSVQQEALEVLQQIQQPVVVVAIVGLYRTGKSYPMNRLAGKHAEQSASRNQLAPTVSVENLQRPTTQRESVSHILDNFDGAAENVTSPCQTAPESRKTFIRKVKVLTAGSRREVLQHAQDPPPTTHAIERTIYL